MATLAEQLEDALRGQGTTIAPGTLSPVNVGTNQLSWSDTFDRIQERKQLKPGEGLPTVPQGVPASTFYRQATQIGAMPSGASQFFVKPLAPETPTYDYKQATSTQQTPASSTSSIQPQIIKYLREAELNQEQFGDDSSGFDLGDFGNLPSPENVDDMYDVGFFGGGYDKNESQNLFNQGVDYAKQQVEDFFSPKGAVSSLASVGAAKAGIGGPIGIGGFIVGKVVGEIYDYFADGDDNSFNIFGGGQGQDPNLNSGYGIYANDQSTYGYEEVFGFEDPSSVDLGGKNPGVDARGQATGQDEGEGEDADTGDDSSVSGSVSGGSDFSSDSDDGGYGYGIGH
jgi:hypothetical protein